MDRRSIKKLILILSIYDLYLEIKSEDVEFISKVLTRDIIISNIMKIIRNGDNINHALKKYEVLSNYR
jgi:hypothetical protein